MKSVEQIAKQRKTWNRNSRRDLISHTQSTEVLDSHVNLSARRNSKEHMHKSSRVHQSTDRIRLKNTDGSFLVDLNALGNSNSIFANTTEITKRTKKSSGPYTKTDSDDDMDKEN